MAKEKYPGIPAVSDERNLAPTVRALVEVVELLIGQRGSGNLRAATKQELAKVGVVLPETRNGG
jgi:hypothetical protein